MANKRHDNTTGQVVIGCVVIGLGLLFLLDNLGVFDFAYTLQLWPVALILAGALKMMQTRTNGGKLVGGLLILAGVLLTMKGLGLIYISRKALLPLVMIGVGALVVYKSLAGRKPGAPSGVSLDKDGGVGDGVGDGVDSGDSLLNVTAILGSFERRLSSQDFRGGEVSAVMGGCDLDLRQASIQGEAVLNVFAVCGGIQIKVPPDWAVSLHGTPILGAFEEKTAAPPHNAKRLIIKGYVIMGGLEVRN